MAHRFLGGHPVQFLIDGYNLLHAVGLAAADRKPGRLKSSRTRLLDWLAASARNRGAILRVVFDAADGPAPTPEADYRGVRVLFAYRQTADDTIERLLLELEPGGVVVVSNDGRLHEAARRRGARSWGCDRFVDWLTTGERPPVARPEPPPEKPDTPAGDDAELLAAFAPKPRPRG